MASPLENPAYTILSFELRKGQVPFPFPTFHSDIISLDLIPHTMHEAGAHLPQGTQRSAFESV